MHGPHKDLLAVAFFNSFTFEYGVTYMVSLCSLSLCICFMPALKTYHAPANCKHPYYSWMKQLSCSGLKQKSSPFLTPLSLPQILRLSRIVHGGCLPHLTPGFVDETYSAFLACLWNAVNWPITLLNSWAVIRSFSIPFRISTSRRLESR